MQWSIWFFLNSILFGIGLAMDAFSVSLANGLHEPFMKKKRMCVIAGVFAGFQIIMPLIGWFCVHTIAEAFSKFDRFIPWIALLILGYIGGKMLKEGIKGEEASSENEEQTLAVGVGALVVQGIATSIDALSVGFTISDYSWAAAVVEAVIIGAVTFIICMMGLYLGKKIGTRIAGKASLLGGIILILIGFEIFITGILK